MKSPLKVIKPASPITVIKGWLPFAEQAPLSNALAAGPWHRALIRGKQIHRKNIVFYEGDPEAARVYTRKATDKEPPIPYADGPAELRAVRRRLQEEYDFSFSACYINLYADETVGIGWHNDSAEVGSQTPVRMLCLGGARTFSIWKVRPLEKPFVEWEELTESGDLVEMPVGFHEKLAYRHAVLSQKRFAAARISLTFRSPDLSSGGPWAPKPSNAINPDGTPQVTPSQPANQPPKVWCCRAGKTYPENAEYVGCKTAKARGNREGSVFGNAVNPSKVRSKKNPWAAGQGLDDPEEKAKAFRAYAEKKMNDDAEFREQVEGLRGKDLLCWCEQDGPNREPFCHARVWLEIANSPSLFGYTIRNQEIVAWAQQEDANIRAGRSQKYHAVLCDPPY